MDIENYDTKMPLDERVLINIEPERLGKHLESSLILPWSMDKAAHATVSLSPSEGVSIGP
jgi:hypothetical protein